MKLTSKKESTRINRSKTHNFSFMFHYYSQTADSSNIRFTIDGREFLLTLSTEELKSFSGHFQKALKFATSKFQGVNK